MKLCYGKEVDKIKKGEIKMQVYFNKKSDHEISSVILNLSTKLNQKKFKSKEEELIAKIQYETLKWVIGDNEK